MCRLLSGITALHDEHHVLSVTDPGPALHSAGSTGDSALVQAAHCCSQHWSKGTLDAHKRRFVLQMQSGVLNVAFSQHYCPIVTQYSVKLCCCWFFLPKKKKSMSFMCVA